MYIVLYVDPVLSLLPKTTQNNKANKIRGSATLCKSGIEPADQSQFRVAGKMSCQDWKASR